MWCVWPKKSCKQTDKKEERTVLKEISKRRVGNKYLADKIGLPGTPGEPDPLGSSFPTPTLTFPPTPTSQRLAGGLLLPVLSSSADSSSSVEMRVNSFVDS